MEKKPAVYMLASKRNGTLYIGVTSDLIKRIWQHRHDVIEGFAEEYRVHLLVYYELHSAMREAIQREKQLKKWNRAWKVALIEKGNPDWRDLYPAIVGEWGRFNNTSSCPRASSGHPDGCPITAFGYDGFSYDTLYRHVIPARWWRESRWMPDNGIRA